MDSDQRANGYLANPTTAQPAFDAPPTNTNQALIFQVTVSDGLLTHTDTVTITVRAFEATAVASPHHHRLQRHDGINRDGKTTPIAG